MDLNDKKEILKSMNRKLILITIIFILILIYFNIVMNDLKEKAANYIRWQEKQTELTEKKLNEINEAYIQQMLNKSNERIEINNKKIEVLEDSLKQLRNKQD